MNRDAKPPSMKQLSSSVVINMRCSESRGPVGTMGDHFLAELAPRAPATKPVLHAILTIRRLVAIHIAPEA
jgi:hypothetical protein